MQLLDGRQVSLSAQCTSSVIAVEHVCCCLAQSLARMASPSSLKYVSAVFVMCETVCHVAAGRFKTVCVMKVHWVTELRVTSTAKIANIHPKTRPNFNQDGVNAIALKALKAIAYEQPLCVIA